MTDDNNNCNQWQMWWAKGNVGGAGQGQGVFVKVRGRD